jgi:hypothetical protein
MEAVALNCPVTCGLHCPSAKEAAAAGGECSDSDDTSNSAGVNCGDWVGKDCLAAVEDKDGVFSTFGELVAVQETCPVACGMCDTCQSIVPSFADPCWHNDMYNLYFVDCFDVGKARHLLLDPGTTIEGWYTEDVLNLYVDQCPLTCITCQSLTTTALVWEDGPVRKFAEESGRIVSSFDAATANATVSTCADIMAGDMETPAMPFEWNLASGGGPGSAFFDTVAVRYNFNDFTHAAAAVPGEEGNEHLKLARQLFCATWAFGEPNMMVHFDGVHGVGLSSSASNFPRLVTTLDTDVGTIYRVTYKSSVQQSRNSWLCKPGMVSASAAGCEPDCANSMKYIRHLIDDVWEDRSFDFVATSARSTLMLWGGGSSFEWVEVTRTGHHVAVPSICQTACNDTTTAEEHEQEASIFDLPSMACVERECGPEYCACIGDESCLQDFSKGRKFGFGEQLDALWSCTMDACGSFFPISVTSVLVDTVNKDCLYKHCVVEYLRCELSYDCVNSEEPHPLRGELDQCLQDRCITLSPTGVPTHQPTFAPTFDPKIPVSERPGLHFLMGDGAVETIVYGEHKGAGRVDDEWYRYPNTLSGEVVWIDGDVCALDASVAATLQGKVVLYTDFVGCYAYGVLYKHGAALSIYWVAEDQWERVSGKEGHGGTDDGHGKTFRLDEIVPYPSLIIKETAWRRFSDMRGDVAKVSLPPPALPGP